MDRLLHFLPTELLLLPLSLPTRVVLRDLGCTPAVLQLPPRVGVRPEMAILRETRVEVARPVDPNPKTHLAHLVAFLAQGGSPEQPSAHEARGGRHHTGFA